MTATQQWLRKASLIVSGETTAIDLSDMHFRFHVMQSNEEQPNNASIRIYNLSDDTVKRITNRTPVEFSAVELKAGYQDGNFGTVFAGSIKQYRRGRESATDTYFDILAASNDVEYNFGTVSDSVIAGSSYEEVVKRASSGMGLSSTPIVPPAFSGARITRGKVLWGMGRVIARNLANSQKAGWSIQNGKMTIIPLNSYLPGEIIVLNSNTGMIGIPEQTNEGISARCLLNPRIYIGGRMHIDNDSINKTGAGGGALALPIGQLAYDQRAQAQMPADISRDGFYMMYVIEHTGDTRGTEWYSDIIGLAMDSENGQVVSNAAQ